MSEQTLYEKIGGRRAVTKIVDHFYDLVLADDTVNHFFEGIDMAKQRAHQTHFMSFALGGPNRYTGKSMVQAHKGLDIQPRNFQTIMQHLQAALNQFGVDPSDIAIIISKLVALKHDVVHR